MSIARAYGVPSTPLDSPSPSSTVGHTGRQHTSTPPDAFDLDRPVSACGWNTNAYMPFGRPLRDCLGRYIAMMEMQVLLITLLRDYSIEWPEGGL